MKKVFFSTAAIVALSLSAFAGIPETKDAKPEAKPEARTEAPLVYHYTGKDASGKIQFAPGEPQLNCNDAGSVPCRWESSTPMTSPKTEAYINSNADVTNTRSN